MSPGQFSSEFGELDSHSLEKAVLDAHKLKPNVSSMIYTSTSCWAQAAALQLLQWSLQEASSSVGTNQHSPASPHEVSDLWLKAWNSLV